MENGRYALVKGDGYFDLPKENPSLRQSATRLRSKLVTLPDDCTTESQVLDLANAKGFLADFLGEKHLTITGRGRRRAKEFQFNFGKLPIRTKGVQIEVDGGYEGDRIYVFEAKIGLRGNFHVRQLFYPFRMWLADKVPKEVVPVFVCYSNRQIFIYRLGFKDPNDYHSIRVVESARYSFDAFQAPRSWSTVLKQVEVGDELKWTPKTGPVG